MNNGIYQQLGAQLSQQGGQQQNPYASLMQGGGQRQPQQMGGGMGYGGGQQGGNPWGGYGAASQGAGMYGNSTSQGGGGGNPFAALFANFGQRQGGGGAAYQPYMPQQGQQQRQAPSIAAQLGSQLRGAPASPIPGYQTPAADQRNPYASTTPQAMDGTGWKDGQSAQGFQVANPYYGQTGYYGDLGQVQAQMAGKAQSSGIPTGVLGASSYTQNPAGQTPWTPDLTPQQKVDQDLASWNANRFSGK